MDLVTKSDFLDGVKSHIQSNGETRVIQFVNANKVAKVSEDPSMKELMWSADYVLTDGQPLLPMARALGIPVPERIDGIGLMGSFLKLANENEFSIYLLGAKQEIVEECVTIIKRDYPNIKIAGFRNGYFKEPESPQIVDKISKTKPDFLFLGMGSPMKEKLAENYRDQIGAKIVQGVGGSFDVMAGLVPRAPVWMQKLCLEWLFRVIQEPRRMFWRYLVTNSRCLVLFGSALFKRIFGKPTAIEAR